MAGVVFIVNVPKKEYEFDIKNSRTNLAFEHEKFERNLKLINQLKQKQNTDVNGVVKCKSSCNLQSNDLYPRRSLSEISLPEGYMEEKGVEKKLSWGEMKQVLRKKNKFVINRKTRGADLLGTFHWDTPLETILADILSRLDIRSITWSSNKDNKFWQVMFSMESGKRSEELLQVLRTFGIGSRYQSSVSVMPCALYYQSNEKICPPSTDVETTKQTCENERNSSWSRFTSSVRARRNLAQVLQDVRRRAALTFDWMFLLVVAAFVSAIGLIEDSTAILVASMLISPLLSAVTAGTLGTAVRDRSLQRMGVRNELLGLFLAMTVGFIVGLVKNILDEYNGVSGDWRTHEMILRSEYRSLWAGALVAIPTGAGVALVILGDYTASLVGVAISAALLPPAVNAGLLWSMALTRLVSITSLTEDELPEVLAIKGTTSVCLTMVNITCIFVSGVVVYKVKKVSPLDKREIPWWRSNKDTMQDSGGDQNSDTTTRPSSLDWDVYNKWCGETLEMKENISKNSPTLTQSDTVTYRRRPSGNKYQLKAQNIENSLRNAQLAENNLHQNTKSKNEDNTKRDDDSLIQKNKTKERNNVLNNSNRKGYNNIAYNNDEENTKLPNNGEVQEVQNNNTEENETALTNGYEKEKYLDNKDKEGSDISYTSDEDTSSKYPTIEPSLNITVGETRRIK